MPQAATVASARNPTIASILQGAVAADVDTVQELTDILVLDEAGLADQRRRPGGAVDVRARDDDLILGARALLDLHTLEHVDGAHALLSQEIPDLDGLAAVGDGGVDGEVSIHQPHLVLELLLHAVEQIVDVAADGAEHGELLRLGEVHLGPDLMAAVRKVQLDGQVLEVALQLAMLALDLDDLGVDGDLDALRHLDGLLLNQGLHGCWRCERVLGAVVIYRSRA
mmetsp:Transcript_176358/g.565505  ORF Transcript_176358/g.565505 Transcript_176358/m.565505 type:complete len:225 (+) Transcript_176358:3-677(+)